MSQQELFPFEAPEPAEMKEVGKGKAVSKAEQAKLIDIEPTDKDKEKAAKDKAERKEAKEATESRKARVQESASDEFKMKNQQRPMISPKGNVFKGAMSGASGGAGGIELEGKMGKNTKPKMKSGGSVRSASARADGCAIRGKTRA